MDPHELEQMLYFMNTEEGVCDVKGIRFNIDRRFTAGAYVITVKDVTKGLPSRMIMKNIKILFKIADLTVEEEAAAVTTN